MCNYKSTPVTSKEISVVSVYVTTSREASLLVVSIGGPFRTGIVFPSILILLYDVCIMTMNKRNSTLQNGSVVISA